MVGRTLTFDFDAVLEVAPGLKSALEMFVMDSLDAKYRERLIEDLPRLVFFLASEVVQDVNKILGKVIRIKFRYKITVKIL